MTTDWSINIAHSRHSVVTAAERLLESHETRFEGRQQTVHHPLMPTEIAIAKSLLSTTLHQQVSSYSGAGPYYEYEADKLT